MNDLLRIGLGSYSNIHQKDLMRNALSCIDNFIVEDFKSGADYDLIYWLYGRGPHLKSNKRLWLSNSKIIIHWIGTDVLDLAKTPDRFTDRIYIKFWDYLNKKKCENKTLINLVSAPWLAEELKAKGIKAKYCPLTSIDRNKLICLDSTDRDIDFLSYCPIDKFKFYRGDTIINLSKKLKNCSFLIISPGLNETNSPKIEGSSRNLRVIPDVKFENMPSIYARSKCFLRLAPHDGLSLSVLEALYFRLQVIWTYPFPFAVHIKHIENLHEVTQNLIENWEPNHEGHRYVSDNFSADNWKKEIKILIEKIAGIST